MRGVRFLMGICCGVNIVLCGVSVGSSLFPIFLAASFVYGLVVFIMFCDGPKGGQPNV